jgi:hypothetical protein
MPGTIFVYIPGVVFVSSHYASHANFGTTQKHRVWFWTAHFLHTFDTPTTIVIYLRMSSTLITAPQAYPARPAPFAERAARGVHVYAALGRFLFLSANIANQIL